ncbi:MAG: YdcF family protein [Deltaproteobacteria bacterium]|nr:YdcF family protein [Deltaproteobacteria bacterium]
MLKYAVTAFAVPPGLFVAAMVCAGAVLVRRKRRGAGALFLSFAAALWILSAAPASDALLRGLEERFSLPSDPRGDVIVLLGGGVEDEAPDFSGEGAPRGEMLGRLVTAARLQKRLGVPVVVSGGTPFKGKKPEAPIVRRFLVDLGVPPDRVIAEDGSHDTFENARYSCDVCRKQGFRRPILVTSAFHMPRAVLLFERAGEKVVPYPAAYRTWPGKRYVWADSLPGAGALRDSALAIKEYLALWTYRHLVPGP